MAQKRAYVSAEETLKRLRNYATEEPSYTLAFAVWDLKQQGKPIAIGAAKTANDELLRLKVVKLIEDGGTGGKVYAYNPIENGRAVTRDAAPSRIFTELDDARVGELAPTRGRAVPHTRARGSTQRPGKDKKLQEQGWTIKRKGA